MLHKSLTCNLMCFLQAFITIGKYQLPKHFVTKGRRVARGAYGISTASESGEQGKLKVEISKLIRGQAQSNNAEALGSIARQWGC